MWRKPNESYVSAWREISAMSINQLCHQATMKAENYSQLLICNNEYRQYLKAAWRNNVCMCNGSGSWRNGIWRLKIMTSQPSIMAMALKGEENRS
jgi:hypothetical protein